MTNLPQSVGWGSRYRLASTRLLHTEDTGSRDVVLNGLTVVAVDGMNFVIVVLDVADMNTGVVLINGVTVVVVVVTDDLIVVVDGLTVVLVDGLTVAVVAIVVVNVVDISVAGLNRGRLVTPPLPVSPGEVATMSGDEVATAAAVVVVVVVVFIGVLVDGDDDDDGIEIVTLYLPLSAGREMSGSLESTMSAM